LFSWIQSILYTKKTVSDYLIIQIHYLNLIVSSALSKRAADYPDYPIVLVCEFYLVFVSDCLYQCQLNTGPTIQSTLYSISVSTFVFTDVPIYKNGVFYGYAPMIQFIQIVYVSQIRKINSSIEHQFNHVFFPLVLVPGSGSATPAVPAVTVTLTTTLTASDVTATPNNSVSANPSME
jgi:hypothetical protein